MAGFGSIADMMQSCAADAVQAAQQSFGFTLDYSPASIESLETILANVAANLQLQDKDAVETAVKLWGAYFGETVRRSFGGAWDLVQYPGKPTAVPALLVSGSQLYPLMKVYRRLSMGEAENIWKFFEKIRSRLGAVQPSAEASGTAHPSGS